MGGDASWRKDYFIVQTAFGVWLFYHTIVLLFIFPFTKYLKTSTYTSLGSLAVFNRCIHSHTKFCMSGRLAKRIASKASTIFLQVVSFMQKKFSK
jgi:hypothetical protein